MASSNTTAPDHDGMFHLRIKSFKDVEIAVPATSVVAHVKQQVRAALLDKDEDDDSRHLRLICKGRILLPDDHPISDFNVQNGDVVHAVLAPVKMETQTSNNDGPNSSNSRRRRRPRNMGTIVGPGGRVTRAPQSLNGDDEEDESSSEEESHSGDGDVEQGQSRRRTRLGFDRLRQPDNGIVPTALPRSEVSAIRSYFSRQVDRYMAQHPSAHTDETDAVRRRHLFEDDWMALQGATSEFRLNLNQNTLLRLATMQQQQQGFRGVGPGNVYGSISVGTDRDFMWGFMLGFFVGFVMLVWVWMPTVPHKQKIGILTGISFQLAVNVFAPPPEDEEGSEDFYSNNIED